ncbi:pantoate--beta-alanine ligase [Rhizobacter sp. Root404]|uniref:pantoate--beta-alanine ligase n=1 Tax=Rhizobacter sp. Root404 TaxID=1736528 RepID=UPI0006F37DA1|nr:pantoate--beta-alanine ligase [Rhizobacter sp. Root404]KQW38424.1 pantoate--beta-alanine ligase [Rhizobacter sp. Root404]
MRIIHTVLELRNALAGVRGIAFVPTMGNLHEGHLSLIERARDVGDLVVASIFVNRLQFAPDEDFGIYPRTLERDCDLLRHAGCDVVFVPAERELYPEEQTFKVLPSPELANVLEGEFRPGFFTGVCTVVLKLFNILQPSFAVFGKKDCQQLFVVRRMVKQFALPIDIVACETIRAADGLALSSRNGYLSAHERVEAATLSRELMHVASEVREGRRDWTALESGAVSSLRKQGWDPDYVAIRSLRDFGTPRAGDDLVVLGAARLGSTRLIDNFDFGMLI